MPIPATESRTLRGFEAPPARNGGPDLKLELAALQRGFRLAFEMSPVAFCIVDRERIVAANRACVGLFGRRDGEGVLGLSIADLLDADSRSALRPLLAHAVGGEGGDRDVHEFVVNLAGRSRKLDVRIAALPGHGHAVWQLTLFDLSKASAERIELEKSRHDLRQLSASVVRAREDARLHLARELHDELGQRLLGLKLELSSLDPACGTAAYAERVAAMLGTLSDTMTAVRRIAADLRPLMLEDLGLNAAVEWLARDSGHRMGIEVAVRSNEADPSLSKEASIAVYRMVQEALTNVARHSHATEVRIELREASRELILTVLDNGVGFAVGATRKAGSFGLLGIRERAYLLGGSLETDNPLAGGARVTVRLPLRRAREGEAANAADATEVWAAT